MKPWSITSLPSRLSLFAILLFSSLSPSTYAKELKISPQWTVVVLDLNGAPKPGIKVSQTWSYWMILDDQRDERVTDAQGRVVFPPRSTSANAVHRKIAEAFGSLPHAGSPAPAANIRMQTDDYKYQEQYFNAETGFTTQATGDAKTVNKSEGLVTTFVLQPIDLCDAIDLATRPGLEHNFSKAKALLAANPASANMVNSIGLSPLHLLYLHNRESTEMAKLLIEAGANIEAKNANGETPLHIAASHDNWEIVEMLLAKGANPNARTIAGRYASMPAGSTPLHMASRCIDPSARQKIVQILTEHGADPTAKDVSGNLPGK